MCTAQAFEHINSINVCLFQKWTVIEDRKLKAGVKKHGEGNWRMILNDFEFDNRTGVNLKDRWRTLKSKGEDF